MLDIREATSEDVPAIVRLLAADQLGAHREDPTELADYLDAFERIETDPNNLLLVVEDDGVVVGTLQLTFIPYLTYRGGWRAQVEAVRVAADRRGSGLGRQLMEWAVEQAEERGCHLIQLTSNKVRDDAHRFYESLGFAATHEGFKRHLMER
ncbi:MAG: GNAT family N-acetyltransferase [Actinobacteria bacterium]|nr:GNAT family N-acetyltransferase [Actinomycetota bacterium]